MQYSNFSDKKFYHLLMKFFEGKYTKRCTASRTTTYKKFHLRSLLWYHIRSQYWNFMTVIEHLFFQTWFFSHKKWHLENNWNRRFCREKNSLPFESFRTSNCQKMAEKIAKYDQDWKNRFLGLKLQICRNVMHAIFF